MNKHNLIKLGALAQQKFGMRDNFRIVEVASNSSNFYKVHLSQSDHENFDLVELLKFGSQDNYEFIRCGYSEKENVLIIKEISEGQSSQ